jgi:hypothetical protein
MIASPNANGYRIEDGADAVAAMASAFDEAWARTGDRAVLHLRVGGRHARVRIAGPELAEMVRRPVAHIALASPPESPPDLTIDLWDEIETGVPGPGCAIDASLGFESMLRSSPDGAVIAHHRPRAITFYDRRAARMVGWSAYEGRAFLDEMGRPLQVPLSFWFSDAGLQIIHAGLVACGDTGILFPGMSGSGKSTSSLSCLEGGLDYLGDDHIGLSPDGAGRFIGHSLYNSTHVEPHHLDRFAGLRAHAIPPRHPEEDKSLILLEEAFPGRMRASVPIAAIALPRVIDADETRARPGRSRDALLALAPSSIVMIPGNRPAGLEALGRLAASVPCFHLELGRHLPSIPQRVREIAAEVSS